MKMTLLTTLSLVSGFLYTALGQYNLTSSKPAAILGKTFKWKCSMLIPEGQTIKAVTFYRNNLKVGTIGHMQNGSCVSVDMNPRYTSQCESDLVYSLVIPSENMTNNEGNTSWRCEYIGDGHYRSPDITLRIAVFVHNLTIIPKDSPLTLTEGTKTTVTCSVNNNAYPSPTIQWFIGDTLVNMTGRDLELTADRDNDGKVLLCRATNNNKSLSASTVLNILYKPVISIAPSSSITVNYGETTYVNCVVLKSNPAKILEYTWSIPEQEEVIGRESSFIIIASSMKDNKTFQCTARNRVGTSKPSYVTVSVLLTPPRPQYVTVFCCDTHADVIWVTAISGHVEQKSFIQFRKSAQHRFSNASTESISTQEKGLFTLTVNDLEQDNTYIFKVITTNQYGSVTSSNTSCRVDNIYGQSASNVTTMVGGLVGGGMTLILVIITMIIVLRWQRIQVAEKRALETPSEQTNYETQTTEVLEDHQYHGISKDRVAMLEPIDKYEEIKSKDIHTYLELEEANPKRERNDQDEVKAYLNAS